MIRPKLLVMTTALVGVLAFSHAEAQQNQQGQTNASAPAASAQQGTRKNLSPEQARREDAELYLSPADIQHVQQALEQKGQKVGKADGRWGEETSRAVKDFQKAQNLDPTGTPTIATLDALGLGNLLNGQSNKTAQNQGNQAQGGQQQANSRSGSQQSARAEVGKGEPVYLAPSDIRLIQQALNQKGQKVGKADGEWGEETSTAVAGFQKAQGLAPTGRPDVSLISALGLSNQVFGGKQVGSQSGQQSGQAQSQGGQHQAGNQGGGQQTARAEVGRGEPLYLGPDEVSRAMQALNQKGQKIGGTWDREAEKALSQFQQAQGLEPTGTFTPETLAALGMRNWLNGHQNGSTNASNSQGSSGAYTGSTGSPPAASNTGATANAGHGQQRQ